MSIVILGFKQEFENGKAVDWVLFGPRGEAIERTQTWRRVDKLRPPKDMSDRMLNNPSFASMKAKWEMLEPAYKAWKEGNEVPEVGMPLGAWPGVNTAQADVLKRMHIKTVEAVAEMTEADIAKLPFPNARDLPKLAREYLGGKDMADLQAQNAALAEKLAALEAAVNEDKPRRGRPPKKTEEEAA